MIPRFTHNTDKISDILSLVVTTDVENDRPVQRNTQLLANLSATLGGERFPQPRGRKETVINAEGRYNDPLARHTKHTLKILRCAFAYREE
jgi:hypothetical protein